MIRGSCLCRGVRWEIDGPVDRMSHCHCSICRKTHGAPFATFLSGSADDFRWVAGEEMIQHFETSPGFNRPFCGTCGSVVPMIQGDRAVMAAGCLDDDPGIRAFAHIFAAHKAPWFDITDDLPQHDAYPPDNELGALSPPAQATAASETLHGSCRCGGVTYEVTTPFRAIYNCHCSRCRKFRAAAHTTNGFTSFDGFRFLSGEDLLSYYKVPDAKTFTAVFCRVCGSGMPRVREDAGTAMIPLASLDDDPGRAAEANIFVGSKAPWYEITDDLPQHEEMIPS